MTFNPGLLLTLRRLEDVYDLNKCILFQLLIAYFGLNHKVGKPKGEKQLQTPSAGKPIIYKLENILEIYGVIFIYLEWEYSCFLFSTLSPKMLVEEQQGIYSISQFQLLCSFFRWN